MNATIEREAVEFVDSIRPAVEPPIRTTETMERYNLHPYPRELYVEGARSKRKNQKKPGDKEPHEELGVEAQPDIYRATHYATCPAMTVFSARAPEGVFAGKMGTVTSLAASAQLESTGVLPATLHPGVGPHIPAPGAELALKLLFTKFARRLKEVGHTPESFADALRPSIAPAVDEYGDVSEDGPVDGVPASAFRRLCYSLKIQMADAQLGSVIISCDTGRDGRVSLSALLAFLSDVGTV